MLVQIVHHIDFYDGSIFQGKRNSLNRTLRRIAEVLKQVGCQSWTLRDPHLDSALRSYVSPHSFLIPVHLSSRL